MNLKSRSLRVAFAASLVLNLVLNLGCAVTLPVDQGNAPQTLGQGAVEVALAVGHAPSIGPVELAGTASNLDSQIEELFSGMRLGIGVLDNLDLETGVYLMPFSGATWTAAVKFQWLGQPFFSENNEGWQATTRVRYLSAAGFTDTTDDTAAADGNFFKGAFVEELESQGFLLSNAFGYRAQPWFAVYFGAEYLTTTLSYKFRQGDETGPLTVGERRIEGYGPIVGIVLNTPGKSTRGVFTLESNYLNLPGTYSDKREWVATSALSLALVAQF